MILDHRDSLSEVPYRAYWADAFRKEDNGAQKYFPSLIMNTAGVRANRGILWSVKDSNTFNTIFPNADNLADLYFNEDKTLPYYQAVSMTNRFPGLSPAAKIKGYGHYMDAGVIDNSGLLSNLDVYNYLKTKDALFANKKVIFIDIINSKIYVVDEDNNRVLRYKYPITHNQQAAELVLQAGEFVGQTGELVFKLAN